MSKHAFLQYQSSGFTLLEVVVSLFLASVILLALVALQNIIFTQEELTMSSYVSIEAANRAVERMVKEIRNSRHGDNGAYTLVQVNDQGLTFFSNADNDSAIERIRYFIDGDSFKKGVINPTAFPVDYPTNQEKIITLVDHLVNGTKPVFYYYNGDWPSDTAHNPLPTNQRLLQTRTIGIDIIVAGDSKYQKTNHEIQSAAEIRTLKDNL
ncbi:prepilin-type N-terminal cleavage/methylation domain-containing protein [Candidatus Beckwithbacteria bacterium]|nr:prepilin-type N-terminal cleavage/methylation domain-containing protein [Candidatus Beckwithbacteria bacterium]